MTLTGAPVFVGEKRHVQRHTYGSSSAARRRAGRAGRAGRADQRGLARPLWREGFGKLAAVYLVSLFGFVVWVGLLISWLFFGGITPPLAS